MSGVTSLNDLRIYTFVFPQNPPGCGWYLQHRPAVIKAAGTWTQTPAYIGNEKYPAQTGDTLDIRAALVRSDATLEGTRLKDLPMVFCLNTVEDIEGLVALSEPVSLTVQK